MVKVRISIDDLLMVLETMKETAGTTEVVIFEYEGRPAIADAVNPDEGIITFASEPTEGESDESFH